MKALKIIGIILLISGAVQTASAQQKVLLSKARVHVGNGKIINQGLVGFEGEDLVLVKNALTYSLVKSEWDTIIDLKGYDIYPGFFAPNSTLGLTEIDAVRATRDFDEVGEFNPHVRALIAFNAESEVSKTARTNGVFYTQATPKDGIISGASSVMKL